MNNLQLNLARKWRSKQFDELVGQDISVKILKNSLYLNQFFPVYLFCGQRGCGKTSMARIFASAVNCQQLELFQKNPKQHVVPCLQCQSCQAMASGQHPDFIEIDAASHTGVDNVRQIIDAASFLPLLGKKKVYLIDEAHMLSKAAFNAFLKVMEEPPAGVLFILATTDSQKIIETVRSRCFQLIFKPVGKQYLVDHLVRVCSQESIRFTKQGLELIVDQSEGSVRDALNILEQVRFASSTISVQTVRTVLGQIDDSVLLQILYRVFHSGPAACIALFDEHAIAHFSAEYIFKRTLELLRSLLWVKQGASVAQAYVELDLFKKIVRETSADLLFECMYQLHSQELAFNKTHDQHAFYQMILLQLSKKNNKKNNSGSAPAAQQVVEASVEDDELDDEQEADEDDGFEIPDDEQDDRAFSSWQLFLNEVQQLQEPLLDSIFAQATVDAQVKNGFLELKLSQDLVFFADFLEEKKHSWLPLLRRYYPSVLGITPQFSLPAKQIASHQVKKSEPVVSSQAASSVQSQKISEVKKESLFNKRTPSRSTQAIVPQGAAFDVSNAELYPKTHMILRYFPSTVLHIQENA